MDYLLHETVFYLDGSTIFIMLAQSLDVITLICNLPALSLFTLCRSSNQGCPMVALEQISRSGELKECRAFSINICPLANLITIVTITSPHPYIILL